MTIKDYLYMDENRFTMSNDHLYITHHDGDEYVFNIKTKQKFHNPVIEDTNKSLATLFDIPLVENHLMVLKFNDKLVYFEMVEPINNDMELCDFTATDKFVGSECNLQLKYGILEKQGSMLTFEVLSKEKVNNQLKTYGESVSVPQFKF